MRKKSSKLSNNKKKKTKLSSTIGFAPGTLIHIGEENEFNVNIEAIRFTNEEVESLIVDEITDCEYLINKEGNFWIIVDGVHKTDLIQDIGRFFKLHSLTLEDIVNTDHRPKYEEFKDYTFITLKKPIYDKITESIDFEQISFILTKKYVLSFEEKPNCVFESTKKRLLSKTSKALEKETDFLTYLLIDAIIDYYYEIIEIFDEKREAIEDILIHDEKGASWEEIQKLRKQILLIKKSISPVREAITRLLHSDNVFLNPSNKIYFNDLYDHVMHINESIDSQREFLSDLIDVYLNKSSHKMNAIMKVLTIISTIFIPITFLAGVYGMNFKNFPEIEYPYSYFIFWGVCIVSVSLMIYYFKKKKWISK